MPRALKHWEACLAFHPVKADPFNRKELAMSLFKQPAFKPMPLLFGLLLLILGVSAHALEKNGFLLDGALVPEDEILQGGPPRDGIPALTNPRFVEARIADYLKPDERVLGLVVAGKAFAYPIQIMDWHEMVNQEIDNRHLLISYCPLCGTGMAFDAVLKGQAMTFGVSGLLYNSDMLMYDRQTQSLWSQIKATAITGPLKGTPLKQIPLIHTRWKAWLEKHPDTLVLSRNTGHWRDYGRSPYGDYDQSQRLFFPVSASDDRYHNKEWVVSVSIKGEAKGYPFAELRKAIGESNRSGVVEDTLGGQKIRVIFSADDVSAHVENPQGQLIPSVMEYWFAWHAFHPDSEVFTAKADSP